MRPDVFAAMIAAQKDMEASGNSSTVEEKRLAARMIVDGKRAGLMLTDKEREELTELKKELGQVSADFLVSVCHPLYKLKLDRTARIEELQRREGEAAPIHSLHLHLICIHRRSPRESSHLPSMN